MRPNSVIWLCAFEDPQISIPAVHPARRHARFLSCCMNVSPYVFVYANCGNKIDLNVVMLTKFSNLTHADLRPG